MTTTTTLPAAACAGRCVLCETLPERPCGPGRLHLWFPNHHAARKAVAAARRTGAAADAVEPTYAVLGADAEALGEPLARMLAAVSGLEAADTRVLFTTGDREPAAADVARVTSLARFQARADADWLVALLDAERLTSLFQPIALGADPSRVVGHEALLRGVAGDGAVVSPARLFGAATNAGLLFQLDLAARRTAIRSAAREGLRGLLFINFAPTAIYDPNTCLRSTVAAIDAAGIPHEQVVFEVVESESTPDVEHLRSILDYYRAAGFRVALDDVGAGYSSLNRLHRLRPDLIKLDMELVRGVHADAYKAVVAEKVIELASAVGVPVLAEGIETAEELAWVRDRGVTYVQGYLVGRPDAVPRAVAPGADATLASALG